MIDQKELLKVILSTENAATESAWTSAAQPSIDSINKILHDFIPPNKLLVRIRPEAFDAIEKEIGPLRKDLFNPDLYYSPDPNLTICVSDKEEKGMMTVIDLPRFTFSNRFWP